jgi:hypothetical protein
MARERTTGTADIDEGQVHTTPVDGVLEEPMIEPDDFAGEDVNPLVARAQELRTDALDRVNEVAKLTTEHKAKLAQLRDELRETCKVAFSVGASREEIADQAGVSVSTVGNWVAPKKAKTEKLPVE